MLSNVIQFGGEGGGHVDDSLLVKSSGNRIYFLLDPTKISGRKIVNIRTNLPALFLPHVVI